MKIQVIPISQIHPNRGQIKGVAENPRQWTKEDVDKLSASILETPEELVARPLIVYKLDEKNYVVLSGNMRLDALKSLKMDKAPCKVFENLEVQKIREIIIKANSQFGEWDVDELANGSWSAHDLEAWGIDEIAGVEATEYGDANKEIDTDEWSENMKLKFKLQPEQYVKVKSHFEGKDARIELLKLVGYGE